MVSPPMMQGASLGADNWPLDLIAWAGTHVAVLTGVATAVETIVVLRVVVVTAAVQAAVGWGTAGAVMEKTGQVDSIVVQRVVVVTAAVTVGWAVAVVTIVVGEDDGLDQAEVVETELGWVQLLRSFLALSRLSGNLKFPSSSISFFKLNSKDCRHWRNSCLK